MGLNFHRPSHSTDSKESVYRVEVILPVKNGVYSTRFIGTIDMNPRVSTFFTKRTEDQTFKLFGRGIGVNAELLESKDFKYVNVQLGDVTLQQTRLEIMKLGIKRSYGGFEAQYILPFDKWREIFDGEAASRAAEQLTFDMDVNPKKETP